MIKFWEKLKNNKKTVAYDINTKTKIVFLYVSIIIGAIFLTVFSLINLFNGNKTVSFYVGLAALIDIMNIFILFFNKKKITNKIITICSLIALSELYILINYLIFVFGMKNSYFAWIYTFPLYAIFFLDTILGLSFSGIFFVSVLTIFLYQMGLAGDFNHDLSSIIRVMGVYVLNVTIITVFNIVIKKMARYLAHEKEQVSAMHNSIDSGIFLVNEDIEIQPQYSKALESIFDKENLVGLNLINFFRESLKDKERDLMKKFVNMLFENTKNPEMLKEINPWENVDFIINGKMKHLSFSFTLITGESNKHFILVTVKDETEEVELRKEVEDAERLRLRDNEFYSELIGTDAKLIMEFIEYSEMDIDKINEILKSENKLQNEKIKIISNILHGMKGNAQAINLITFGKKIHEIEDKIKAEGANIDILNLVIMISKVTEEIEKLELLMVKIINFKVKLDVAGSESLLILPVIKAIEKVNSDPEIKKKIKLLTTEFNNEIIPQKYRKLINDVLNQFVRNSIYHGIETIYERETKKKSQEGKIEIQTKKENNKLFVIFKDDGRGIDEVKLKEKLKSNQEFNKIGNFDKVPNDEIYQYIFESGLSTSDTVDLTAGRGVGLSYVKESIKNNKGAIKVFSQKDRYCIFKIALPI